MGQRSGTAATSATTTVSGAPPVGLLSITARFNRPVIKTSKWLRVLTAYGNGHPHGYTNLRQRSSSPAHQVVRLWKDLLNEEQQQLISNHWDHIVTEREAL